MAKLGFHAFHLQAWKQYGPIVSVWFGGLPWVLISDPDVSRKVMFRLNNRKEFPQVLDGDNKEVDVKGFSVRQGRALAHCQVCDIYWVFPSGMTLISTVRD